ncbi:MAG: Rrf2 family transcriptional regulator [Kiritimatiellae bacterium]|nr:Rrf2 family transcriptional regulator [Kiritimatiellia bacterium]
MKISARTRYGLRILLDIAANADDPSPRSIKTIAKSQGISAPFISRLAVPMKRKGLISSARGVAGGLRLAKPADEISLLDIMTALDGPVSILKCISQAKRCKRSGFCGVRSVWKELNDLIADSLRSVTLAKVMERTDHENRKTGYCI